MLIDMHKKFLDSSNSSDSSRKGNTSFHANNLNSPPSEPKISVNPNQSIHNPKLFIPKLDLTQAKKIQEYNAKRTTPQNNTNNSDMKLVEKVQG